MKKITTLLAIAGLFAACDKDDSKIAFPDEPVLNAVTGKFMISFDSTAFRIDSIRSYYLNPVGFIDSATTTGTYRWESPVRRFNRGDTGYAAVRAYGVRLAPAATIPEMTFSEYFKPFALSSRQASGTDPANFFFSERGFRF